MTASSDTVNIFWAQISRISPIISLGFVLFPRLQTFSCVSIVKRDTRFSRVNSWGSLLTSLEVCCYHLGSPLTESRFIFKQSWASSLSISGFLVKPISSSSPRIKVSSVETGSFNTAYSGTVPVSLYTEKTLNELNNILLCSETNCPNTVTNHIHKIRKAGVSQTHHVLKKKNIEISRF